MLDRHRHHVEQDDDHDEDIELLVDDQLEQLPLWQNLGTIQQHVAVLVIGVLENFCVTSNDC